MNGVHTQSKTSAVISIDYCGIIQNIEEQCEGIFTDDIYLKIIEDNVLNNFDKNVYAVFSQIGYLCNT